MNIKSPYRLLLPILFFMPGIVFGQDGYVGTTDGVTAIAGFIINVGYTIGLLLVVHGLYAVYARGEQPTQYPISYCVSNILAGTMLLISSTVYAWTVNSVAPVDWATDASMLAINSKLADDSSAAGGFLGKYLPTQAVATLMGFIYIVGLVGFLRGIFLLKNSGQMNNGKEGGFAQAFWHMMGGVACMNIIQVGCFISWLLGISMLCME